MATLHDVLKDLPKTMVFRSHLDGTQHTVSSLLSGRNESNCVVGTIRLNYGRDIRTVIFSRGVLVYTEVPKPSRGIQFTEKKTVNAIRRG